jgi:hypothetical protein
VLKRAGAAIILNVSKTKQTGDGKELPIEEGPALQAVRAWVQAASIKAGTPLWRTIRKGHVQPERMHQRALHNIIQRRAEQMLRARRDEHGKPVMYGGRSVNRCPCVRHPQPTRRCLDVHGQGRRDAGRADRPRPSLSEVLANRARLHRARPRRR